MDPLDDLFAAMRVDSAAYARLETSAPWGVNFACGHTARFGLVVSGGCWLELEGRAPQWITAGDCYVLVRGLSYILRDHPRSPAGSCTALIKDRVNGRIALGGGGQAASIVTGWFTFDAVAAQPLVDLLPTLLHAQVDAERAQLLQSTLELLQLETRRPGLGSGLVVSRLADIVFVQAIRAHVTAGGGPEMGWLGALSDRRIGPALRAMHGDLARPWTVDALARAAGQSRSAFALRFRQRVGEPPLDYLTRWRMFRAGCLLRQSDRSLGEIAGLIGYESEAAFNKAFKRTTGVPPGSWRRGGAQRGVRPRIISLAVSGRHRWRGAGRPSQPASAASCRRPSGCSV